MPIAVLDFAGDGSVGQDLAVIVADLERSGLFRPVDREALSSAILAECAPAFRRLARYQCAGFGDGRAVQQRWPLAG